MSSTGRLFRGGRQVDALGPDDRGFRYGDGLFETMRAHRGVVPWWPAHWQRLASGAARLGLPLPPAGRVLEEAATLLAGRDAVLRLQLTRGAGGRGYAPPAAAEPTWALSLHPLPTPPAGEGLRLRWCELRLGAQPALAGLKHCNRLEQVLARAELETGEPADEGLLRGPDDELVSAIAANVFVLLAGEWLTPPVDRCGVAGVCRGWLLGQGLARVRNLSRGEVERADAMVLGNAVRGILPVSRLGGCRWPPHPRTAALRAALAAAHPAFADTDPETA